VHECDRQTDRRTDRRTDRITMTKTVQRIALHGKNRSTQSKRRTQSLYVFNVFVSAALCWWAKIKQESCAIAKMTAECAPYMDALKIVGTPWLRPRLLFSNFSWALFWLTLCTKFKVRSFTRSWDNRGTQKWAIPGYAHAPSSPKFLMGFSSDASYECTCQIWSP